MRRTDLDDVLARSVRAFLLEDAERAPRLADEWDAATGAGVDDGRHRGGHESIEEEINMIEIETPTELDEHRGGSKRAVTIVLVAAALVIAFALGTVLGDDEAAPPADQPSPTLPATVPPSTGAPDAAALVQQDLELIQEGVAAFYSGDADRAAELFDLADRTDDQLRAESAYQAAIGGRVDVSCTQGDRPATYRCLTPYRNAMTDAVDASGGNDVWDVVVTDGVITRFGFTEHTSMLLDMGTFLASEGRFDGFERCLSGPFAESCATIELENLDAWAAWSETAEPVDRIEAVLDSWFAGACEAAVRLSWDAADCSPSSVPTESVEYESLLGAEVSLDSCETTTAGDHTKVSCDVHYSNAMNRAVGKAPAVSAREFLLMYGVMPAGAGQEPWYEVSYPEDTELRDSFRQFAEGGELADEYAAEGCATKRTVACARLIKENLDAWAAWYASS